MDDLASRLNEILTNPESMERIKNLASKLGTEKAAETAAPTAAPTQKKDDRPGPAAPALDPETLGAVMKIAPALSRFRQEDDATRLLRALRPFLGDTRQKKLDEALRLMQLLRVVPFFKSSGLF